ncbi:FecR family protein [Sphingobacterium psychroaquaticum]|uniref:FecR family protein n=1 Tax=Sphingobacterium psychroaquaticum TaxID=561061 RepID=UPI00106D1FF7|nr:FecR family protein [Sphingobacterium psychroaquaticum]QBQ41739.1 FecR family protein [Sphingobacterium psychroaquaticum]
MDTEQYKKLLEKYLNGQCSPEEEKLLQNWYDGLDVLNAQQQASPEGTELKRIGTNIWEVVADATLQRKKKRSFAPFFKVAVAASLVLGFSWFYYEKTSIIPLSYRISVGQPERLENNSLEIKKLLLSDGTKIQLYPGASLSFPKIFEGSKREVFLQGKAFFEVAKNKKKPFIVHNYHHDIHVVGTSFMVQSTPDIAANFVEVRTGKVKVSPRKNTLFSSEKQQNTVVLTPNKRFVYNAQLSDFKEAIVSSPRPMNADMESHAAQYSFSFMDTPIQDVVDALEGMYGIQITFTNSKMKDCTFTGNLNDEDLFKKLKLLCATLGAKYSIHDSTIIIEGEGC